MERERDIWFYFAVLVSAVALFVWAFWALTGLGSGWVPWAVVALLALASVSIVLRFKLTPESAVWTAELREAETQWTKKVAWEAAKGLLFILLAVAIVRLARYDWLPELAGAVLLLVLLAAWFYLKRAARRSRA